jgi:hypothetical protein
MSKSRKQLFVENPDLRKKIGEMRRGHEVSAETRGKIGKKNSKKHTKKHRRKWEDSVKWYWKEVEQYDLCGNYINSYRSINKASVMTGSNKGNLIEHLKGNRKTCNNYIFKLKKQKLCDNFH